MTHRDVLQEAPDKQAEIEHTLDDYERELLQAIEEGQLAPMPGPIPDKTRFEEAARKTLAKSERLTIRLTKMDLQALKHCAAREGVPYHTLISSVLHKYVTGQLVPSRHLAHSTMARHVPVAQEEVPCIPLLIRSAAPTSCLPTASPWSVATCA